jgi:hypothetical protein
MSTATNQFEVREAISRLEELTEIIPPLLFAIPENSFSARPSPGKWSKKEILGHLVDSAANNHQRFVRVQFETVPSISYDTDQWNAASGYSRMSGDELIAFWADYNKFLARLLRLIPNDALSRTCNTGEKTVDLAYIIIDYVSHMEHHLAQLVAYK